MSYQNLISEELSNVKIKKGSSAINSHLIQSAIIDSVIKNDEKAFAHMMTEYAPKINIFAPFRYEIINAYTDDENDNIEHFEYDTKETSILKVVLSQNNPYFILYLVKKFNLNKDENFITDVSDALYKKDNFIIFLNLFKEEKELQKDFLNIGILNSLICPKESDAHHWFYTPEHLDKLEFIIKCLKNDEIKESFCNYYLNSDVNIKNLSKIINMNKGMQSGRFLEAMNNIKEILSLLNDDAKMKAFVELSNFKTYHKDNVNKKLTEKEELDMLSYSEISVMNKEFLNIFTSVSGFKEKVKENSTLKVILVMNEFPLRRSIDNARKGLIDLNEELQKSSRNKLGL